MYVLATYHSSLPSDAHMDMLIPSTWTSSTHSTPPTTPYTSSGNLWHVVPSVWKHRISATTKCIADCHWHWTNMWTNWYPNTHSSSPQTLQTGNSTWNTRHTTLLSASTMVNMST